jgi:hypothetical protein
MTEPTPPTESRDVEYEAPAAVVAGTIRSLTQDKSGSGSDGGKSNPFPSGFGG